jgi:DNA invertase Pin-like site-specific DNA recombinase
MNVIYCRFSPRPKGAVERSETIEIQEQACRRYCQFHGITVDRIIHDREVSARKTPFFDRPGGSELKGMKSGDRVIVMKLDRIFRDAVDGLLTFKHFEDLGVEVHLADQGGNSINVSTAVGKLITTMLLSVAAYEPAITAERTSQAMRHRIKKGGNHLPAAKIQYGLEPDPDSPVNPNGVHSRSRPCNHEQLIISDIMVLHRKHYTPSNISTLLNKRQITCRGKSWSANQVDRVIQRQLRTERDKEEAREAEASKETDQQSSQRSAGGTGSSKGIDVVSGA